MQGFTDKEILCDGLSAQKATTAKINTSAGECANMQLKDTMMKILEQEHNIQYDVFQMMHQRGLYDTPAAPEQKVQQTKQTYANCLK